ncbi:MAG: DUF805 domain-containing protein [Pseudomonadota bacterium]|nr:DUF805 domain-containing protein [Pseudomonadota bacterium]
MAKSNVPSQRQVGFAGSLPLFFKNYLNFSGRSGPSAYWWYMLWSLIFMIPLGLIDSLLLGITPEDLFSLSNLFGWVTLIPSISLSVRRLHDIDKSGWWLLISFTIIGIPVLIYWAIKAGDRQENSYGADMEAGKALKL